jgi:hypothetical protein
MKQQDKPISEGFNKMLSDDAEDTRKLIKTISEADRVKFEVLDPINPPMSTTNISFEQKTIKELVDEAFKSGQNQTLKWVENMVRQRELAKDPYKEILSQLLKERAKL